MASLYHYGILGMRWGIRRRRGSDGLVMPGTREGIVSTLRREKLGSDLYKKYKKEGMAAFTPEAAKEYNKKLDALENKKTGEMDYKRYGLEVGSLLKKGVDAGYLTPQGAMTSKLAKVMGPLMNRKAKDIRAVTHPQSTKDVVNFLKKVGASA